LALDGAWITAPVRCAPPANKPTVDERERCRPFLQRELALLAGLRVFVALGRFGYEALCGVLGLSRRPPFGHGVEAAVPGGGTLLGSYHVSQQNTFTGRLTEPMLDAVLWRARALAGLPPPRR
jgi:uracil-DNA glycosylase